MSDKPESGFTLPPTNAYAAKRPYCRKHSRALVDIGGQKMCPACRDEQKQPSTEPK